MNRFLMYSILVLNMAKAFIDFFDTIMKRIDPYANDFCNTSMWLKTFLFDMSCLLTVQHMNIILKHVEDPLVNKTNKVVKPIFIASLFSLLHVLLINNTFHAEFNHNDETC